MSMLYIDSCGDHYDQATALEKWTSTAAGSPQIVPGWHGNGIKGINNINKAFQPVSALAIVGFRMFCGQAGNFTLGIGSGGSVLNMTLATLIDGTGRVNLQISGQPNKPCAPNTILNNTWHFFEIEFFQDAVAGYCHIYMDGTLIIGSDGINTIVNAGVFLVPFPYWVAVEFTVQADYILDDLYVFDGFDDGTRMSDGHDFASKMGDIEIDVIRPNGAGFLTQWTPSPNQPNFQNVNEFAPDLDATYNFTTSVGVTDLFEMDDVGLNFEVLGAQLMVSSRRTSDGFAAVAPQLRQSGTIYQVGPPAFLGQTYIYHNRIPLPMAPNGSAWTPTILNALQAGYKRTA